MTLADGTPWWAVLFIFAVSVAFFFAIRRYYSDDGGE
jgi:hypothetical protein